MLGLDVIPGKHAEPSSPSLERTEIPSATASYYRKLGRKPADRIPKYKAACNEQHEIMSKVGFLRFDEKADHQVLNTSESNEWYTPAEYLENELSSLELLMSSKAGRRLSQDVIPNR